MESVEEENKKVKNITDPGLEALLKKSTANPEHLESLITYFLLSLIAQNPKRLQHYAEDVLNVLGRWEGQHKQVKAYQYFIKGSIQFYLSNFAVAEQELVIALEEVKVQPHKETEGIIRTLLGANYRSMGEMDLAIENQLRAYQFLPKQGIYATYRILCLYQLGETHVAIRDFTNALFYYKEAVETMGSGFNSGIRFRVYSGLAICQMHIGAFEDSIRNINVVLQIPGLSVRMQSRAMLDMGMIHSSQKKHIEAIANFRQSYELRKTNELMDASSTSLLYLAREYIATGQYTEALQCLNEALPIIEEFSAKGKKITALELLARVHQSLGQYETSTGYYKEFIELRELEHAEQERRIFRFKNNLIEQQRKELDDKNQLLNATLDELSKVKRSRKAMIYGILTVIILVLLTEIFVDPLIDAYAYNNYISLALKALIALLLKPIDSFYESMLFNRAFRKREG